MKILKSSLTDIFFIALITSCYLLTSNIQTNRILIVLLFLITFYFSYKKLSPNLIINLFLVALFTFQIGRVVLLPLLFDLNLKAGWFLEKEIFQVDEILFMNNLLYFTLLGINLGVILFPKYNLENIEMNKNINDKLKFYTIILIACSGAYIYNQLEIIKRIYLQGYLSLYKTSFSSFNKSSLIIKILSNIYYYGSFLMLAYIPTEKRFNKYKYYSYINILLIGIFLGLRGSRNTFVVLIFMLIWYNYLMFSKKIYKTKIFILGVLLIFFSEIYGQIRIKENISETTILKKIENFFFEQGGTGLLLVLPKINSNILNNEKLYILSPILSKKYLFQDNEVVNDVKNGKLTLLQDKISVELNETMYLNGNGSGGNYILEMYQPLKEISVFILSFILSYSIITISYLVKKVKILFKAIIIFIIPQIFMIPRSNYLINIDYISIIKIILIFMIMENIYMLIKFREGFK